MALRVSSFKKYCVCHLCYVFEPSFLCALSAVELLGMFANLALQLNILSVSMRLRGRISVLPVAGTAEAGGYLCGPWTSPLLEKLTLPRAAKCC